MINAALFGTWLEDKGDDDDITAKPMLIPTKTAIIPRKREYFADDEAIQKFLDNKIL
jgi:hypothetical protein